MNTKNRGRDYFERYKKILDLGGKFFCLFPKKTRIKLFNSVRNVQGYKGLAIRYVLLKTIAERCGDNVSIHPNVFIFNIENLYIGNNVSIHPMCYIECFGGLEIQDDISIAHSTSIVTTEHIFLDINQKINNQGIRKCPIIIKNNVWIGCKVTILGNTTIESGVVIGANSLVKKRIEKNLVVGGNPLQIIKERK
ncbi:acyltransferase [Enterococcus casseliflavus]|uniref:acyltransferase n=1 Tax=Enterococcus casseliflavus TaxID=37734 RepID=UPI003D0E0F3E